jgi:GNAT superfamily N-acetyltransferase
VAVAGINDPEPGPWPPALQAVWAATGEAIGAAALDRLKRFEATSAGLEPGDPHYYLGIIGVRPGLQGRGFARTLVDELVGMSRTHPRSTGIALTTEQAGNVPLYRRFGFDVIGEADIDDLHTWVMFRPDR